MTAKRFLACVSIVGMFFAASLGAEERHPYAYIGVNPIALAAFVPPPWGATLMAFGMVSGSESGIAPYGGWQPAPSHSVEARLSTGPANLIFWETQLQLGYIWYPCESFL
jgi:hypothetical protein